MKLFWKYSNQPVWWVMTVPERHRQTDRQTTYCGITALCIPSRGKKKTKAVEQKVRWAVPLSVKAVRKVTVHGEWREGFPRKECLEPGTKRRRGGWWKRWGWGWADMIVKEWRIRKRMMRIRLMQRARKLIPEVRWCMSNSKWAICNFQSWAGWRSSKCDEWWWASAAKGLGRY